MTTELKVPDASCGHCKQTIETAVSAIAGVSSADLDLDSKVLRIEHDAEVALDKVVVAVSGAGYTPEVTAS